MSIEISGVSRFFGSTCAVQDVTMSVPPGSVTGLVGSNGAGKTTLLLMLPALLAPDSGTIRVAGLDPLAQPREVHQAVGWMPDAFGTWDSLTCTEILLTFAAAQGFDGATAARRCAEWGFDSLSLRIDSRHTGAKELYSVLGFDQAD